MKAMTVISYPQHSELQQGPVREEHRWHRQPLLAWFICRKRQMSVQDLCGLPLSGGAALLWPVWCGTRPWWSVHGCAESKWWVRVGKNLSKLSLFLKRLALCVNKTKRKLRQTCWNCGLDNKQTSIVPPCYFFVCGSCVKRRSLVLFSFTLILNLQKKSKVNAACVGFYQRQGPQHVFFSHFADCESSAHRNFNATV